MIVAELIEKLQKLPPTATVFHYDPGEGGYNNTFDTPMFHYSKSSERLVFTADWVDYSYFDEWPVSTDWEKLA